MTARNVDCNCSAAKDWNVFIATMDIYLPIRYVIAPCVGFTDKTDLYGIHGSVRWNFVSDWVLGLSGEWIESEAGGFLQNNNRAADLLSEARGAWIQPAVYWRKH